MRLVRIEYNLNGSNWKANILAKDVKDGISFLEGYLKAPFSVVSTEDVCEVHGTSDHIKNLFVEVKEVKPLKKEEIDNTPVQEQQAERKPGRPPKK